MAPSAALVAPSCLDGGGQETNATEAAAPAPADHGLAGRVEQALGATGYATLRAVEVAVADGLVHLQGRVPTYYLKQLAQAAALEVPGVRDLRNDVEVVRQS